MVLFLTARIGDQVEVLYVGSDADQPPATGWAFAQAESGEEGLILLAAVQEVF